MEDEQTAPPTLWKIGALMKRVFMFLGLLALASCVTPQGIKDRKPDYLANFSGSPEAVAKCIADDWFNQFGQPLVTSTRNGLLSVSNLAYPIFAFWQKRDILVWELTLRPDGVAEVRGFPTIWGWVHGEEAVPLVEKCGK